MQNYLLYGFPFVLALIVWSGVASSPHGILYELFSYNFMLWFVMFITYMILLVLIPSVRDKTLSRLANLKERDEREEYITGKAARESYIATLALTLLFLFFSLFGFTFASVQQTDPQKPGHTVGMNIGYSIFNHTNKNVTDENKTTIFDSKQYALSSSSIILLLLGWQILIFNLAARKERLRD